jgi:hypothetical protein
MRIALCAWLLVTGCAHTVQPAPSPRPPARRAAPTATSEGPTAEPFVRERAEWATPASASKYTVGPTVPGVSFVDKALFDDSLDAKWGPPWRAHVPKVKLAEEHDKWAVSLGHAALSVLRALSDGVVKAHRLADLRATWIATLEGGDNTTTDGEAFDTLLAECRHAVEELDSVAKEKREGFDAMEPPAWDAYRATAAAAHAERIVSGTKAEPSYVGAEARASVDAALRALRAGVLDEAFATALPEARARIMLWAKKPQKP